MSDKKISQFTNGSWAQLTDEFPIARGTANFKLTLGDVFFLASGSTGANYKFPQLNTTGNINIGGTGYFTGSVLVNDGSKLAVGTTAPKTPLQSSGYAGAAAVNKPTLGYPDGGALLITNNETTYGILAGVGYGPTAWIQSQYVASFNPSAITLAIQPTDGNVSIGGTGADAKLVIRPTGGATTDIQTLLTLRNDGSDANTGAAIKFGFGNSNSALCGNRIISYGNYNSTRQQYFKIQRPTDDGTGWLDSLTITPGGTVDVPYRLTTATQSLSDNSTRAATTAFVQGLLPATTKYNAPLAVASGGLGRLMDTNYYNTGDSCWVVTVAVDLHAQSGHYFAALVNKGNSEDTVAWMEDVDGFDKQSITFVVPPGYRYKLTATYNDFNGRWYEWHNLTQ